jgi:hypothetical protein
MSAPDSNLHVIGVRHHSPACAKLVRSRIHALKPAFVLIEGPVDFNAHIEDLFAPHQLPVAIFSYHTSESQSRASYSPFCDYSPEWQALLAAREVGAQVLFCDLPAWHPDFGDRSNRYADSHSLQEQYARAHGHLERQLGAEGQDALWDTMVEQSIEHAETPEFQSRMHAYFEGLRPEQAEDSKEAGREDFMGRYAAWAIGQAQGRPRLSAPSRGVALSRGA